MIPSFFLILFLLLLLSLAYIVDAFQPVVSEHPLQQTYCICKFVPPRQFVPPRLISLRTTNASSLAAQQAITDAELNDTTTNEDANKKLLARKVADGLKVAPSIVTLPLYSVGFGIIGPKHMWKFSKWIYGLSNPSDEVLNAHFDRVAAYLYSGKEIASRKLVSYKVHPLFAGLSLISTAVLLPVCRPPVLG